MGPLTWLSHGWGLWCQWRWAPDAVRKLWLWQSWRKHKRSGRVWEACNFLHTSFRALGVITGLQITGIGFQFHY